jgi:phage anti-repressor protein
MTTTSMKSNQLSNNILQVFKPDNSKLIKLASQMISQGQIKTSLEFAKKFMFIFDSEEQFPIDIMMLVDMKVYDRKDSAKKVLIKTFEKETDYRLISFASVSTEAKEINLKRGGGKNEENIMLTVDYFKNMCMMPRNEIGKQVQRYYLDLEKVVKQYMIIEYQSKQQQIVPSCRDLKVSYYKIRNKTS